MGRGWESNSATWLVISGIRTSVSQFLAQRIWRSFFTILGATGKQGGALDDSILAHPPFPKTFALRGVTRDASKPATVALQQRELRPWM
jgi:hypothetical protein